MKKVINREFNGSCEAAEYYNLIYTILNHEGGIKVFLNDMTVSVVGNPDKIKELKEILNG